MNRKQEIINKLSQYGQEMSEQDHRGTSNPLWCDYKPDARGNIKLGAFSFFESDVFIEDNYVISNYDSFQMKDLQNLLIELGEISKND